MHFDKYYKNGQTNELGKPTIPSYQQFKVTDNFDNWTEVVVFAE
jgi:hypothetical protein